MADMPVPEDPRPAAGDEWRAHRACVGRGPGPHGHRAARARRGRPVDPRRVLRADGTGAPGHAPEAISTQSWPTSPRPRAGLPEPSAVARTARRWHVAVMSGHSTKGRWRISGKTSAVAVMGGCDLDLRRAEIDGPEVEITAVAFWGGIKVIVPEGFDVELRGFSFMGGRSLRLRDVPIVRGSPRIVVRGFAVMGSIDVVSRSSQSGRQAARAVSEGMRSMADQIDARSGPGRTRSTSPRSGGTSGARSASNTAALDTAPAAPRQACPTLPGSPVAAAAPDPEPPAPAASRPTRTVRHRRHRDHPVLRHGRLRRDDRAPGRPGVPAAVARPPPHRARRPRPARRSRDQRAGRRLHARLRWRGPGPPLRGRHPARHQRLRPPRRRRDHRRAHRRAHRRRGGRG